MDWPEYVNQRDQAAEQYPADTHHHPHQDGQEREPEEIQRLARRRRILVSFHAVAHSRQGWRMG
jgi:hypothetical protein